MSIDIREYLKTKEKGLYKILCNSMTLERRKQLYFAINNWRESELKLLNTQNIMEQSEQLICVESKHYTGITKGKVYKVFQNPDGFDYPHKRFIHITNDLGFIKAYYRSCFESI